MEVLYGPRCRGKPSLSGGCRDGPPLAQTIYHPRCREGPHCKESCRDGPLLAQIASQQRLRDGPIFRKGCRDGPPGNYVTLGKDSNQFAHWDPVCHVMTWTETVELCNASIVTKIGYAMNER